MLKLTAEWRTSSFSGSGGEGDGGSDSSCVEVSLVDGEVSIRNSNNPDGGTVTFTTDEWWKFTKGVRFDEFEV